MQDGVDPSPDGLISYDEWQVIWTNSTLLALADKVIPPGFPPFRMSALDRVDLQIWFMTPGDPMSIEDLIKTFNN